MTMTTDEFVAQMKQLEAEAERKTGQALSSAYDKLIDKGRNEPPKQPEILDRTLAITLGDDIAAGIGAFYNELADAIEGFTDIVMDAVNEVYRQQKQK